MSITIELPQVGESVIEGIVEKWLKQPGEQVKKYEPLVEVVTDKVTIEVPSPVSGIIKTILVEEGTTVAIGTPIAIMESDEPDEQLSPKSNSSKPTSSTSESERKNMIGHLDKDATSVGPTGGGIENITPLESHTSPPNNYSPAVRRLAKKNKVNLAKIHGTGINGRVTSKDVQDYISKSADLPKYTQPTPINLEQEEISISATRRIIAANMAKSKSEIPHAWSMIEADVTELVQYRDLVKIDFKKQEGIDLTYLPFIINATSESLHEYPTLNASWGNNTIVRNKQINVSVAIDTPSGLSVPVIHNANLLSITQLSHALHDLASKAKNGKLSIKDVENGTFTVNNTGALGSVISSPIINYPQAAILTTELIVPRPVVIDNSICIRSIMNLCISFDHRVLDGSDAAKFMQAIKHRLESINDEMPLD